MTTDLLTVDQIRIHPGSVTREEAIAEAAALLESAGAVTSTYLDAMLERERTVSTYMGNELAIPHGTNAAKGTVRSSALALIRYDGGVDWGGEQVRFVVGIAGQGDAHLGMLAQIAILFSDTEDVERLKAAATPADLHTMLSTVNS